MAIDFRIRDHLHPWAIPRLRRTLERTQWLSPDELDAYRQRRLSRVLRQAWKVPYYRRLFARHGLVPGDLETVRDLERLPLLTREDLGCGGPSLLAENAWRTSPRWHTTSGTSGAPVRFASDRGSRVLEFCYYWRHWSWAGYRLGDRFAELGSLHFLHRRRQEPVDWQPLLGRLMLDSTRLSPGRAVEMAAAIARYRPRFLKGTASALYYFAVSLEDAGAEVRPCAALFSTGEVLAPHYRALLERVFQCPVLDSYGHMERTVAIAQCLDGGYHVQADYGVLELPSIRRAADGTRLGRVVGTSLYNLAMPLLRYDVGDDVELLPSPRRCSCGRTLPLVKAVHGRSEDTIVTPDGRFLTALFLLPGLAENVRGAQVQQQSATELTLLVVPGPGFSAADRDRLAAIGARLAGSGMRFRVVRARDEDLVSTPSGKRRVVIGL